MRKNPVTMKNYTIISEMDPIAVQTEVNRHLALGAVLIGGLTSVTSAGHYIYYSQAIAYPTQK